MTKLPFSSQRDAALALLTGGHQAGQFLGQLAVDPLPMTDKQSDWLAQLLAKHDLPPLAEGGA